MVSHNTIGLMMDCDTTGIEPDLALVKFKKLVGGGSMQIVNQTVPRALQNLGYPHEQVEAIVEYIAEHGHVVDAPGLRPEHYEVFDCAMGERAISPDGPRPDDGGGPAVPVRRDQQDGQHAGERHRRGHREDVYVEGWKLGLKALAIYRDNCKVGQPLSDARKKPAEAAATAGPACPGVRASTSTGRSAGGCPSSGPATVTRFSGGRAPKGT